MFSHTLQNIKLRETDEEMIQFIDNLSPFERNQIRLDALK